MECLSLIIPAHNAGKFIEKSILEYNDFFSKYFRKLELIVVCNACKDNTFDICTRLKKELPLKVVNVPERGKGNAIIKGFNLAEHNIIGFLDADNPFDLDEILKMIKILDYKEIVIISKFKKGTLKYQTSIDRRIFSIAGSIISKIIFNLPLSDTQAGAKFMRRYVWDKLDKDFICMGFEFDIEFLYKANKKGFTIYEYFLKPKDSDFSTVKLRILPGILKRLFILRFLR